jgi:hypothetical protein
MSMAAAPGPVIHYFVLLPHACERRVLMLPDAGAGSGATEGASLPHWIATEPQFWHVVGPINQQMRERFGVEATVLRCIDRSRDAETGDRHRTYAMENHSPSWTLPAGARWVGEKELAELDLARPRDLALLQRWFVETRAENVPPKRVAWARAGWIEDASAWIGTQVDRSGNAVVGPIEQLRTWQRSCVLRASTTSGAVYFKAVPPMFALEPRLTRALAEQYPTHSPEVLAVDEDRHWLLTREFGGRPLEPVSEIERWEEAVRAYARIQADSAPGIERLMALGCPDRRLERLAAAIDPLVEDTSLLLPGQEHGLSAAEIGQLRRLAPRLKAMCDELAGYRVPPSLEHGDFYYGQIFETDGSVLFIDWSDSSVAHPFFSMFLFSRYAEMEQRFPPVPDARARLREAYLEPWTVYESMDRLIAAFELAQLLAAVHGAVFYQQFVLPHLEVREEWEAMAPWFLKLLLRDISRGPG